MRCADNWPLQQNAATAQQPAEPCCAVLCRAVLCCAVLCSALLCSASRPNAACQLAAANRAAATYTSLAPPTLAGPVPLQCIQGQRAARLAGQQPGGGASEDFAEWHWAKGVACQLACRGRLLGAWSQTPYCMKKGA